ncbi:hypothetical protein F2P81_002335 [Scophthalmus maximus]|uniref:Uncharacterized protein n=1 Tax=Scophthalmus maximus TaxID=52904 RepID=A0A6A4TDZ2_SCOMX|nr:hypothetical protein F2P81_002335 [Scophthalmus maximus]
MKAVPCSTAENPECNLSFDRVGFLCLWIDLINHNYNIKCQSGKGSDLRLILQPWLVGALRRPMNCRTTAVLNVTFTGAGKRAQFEYLQFQLPVPLSNMALINQKKEGRRQIDRSAACRSHPPPVEIVWTSDLTASNTVLYAHSLRKPTWLFMPRTLRAEHYRSLKPALVVRQSLQIYVRVLFFHLVRLLFTQTSPKCENGTQHGTTASLERARTCGSSFSPGRRQIDRSAACRSHPPPVEIVWTSDLTASNTVLYAHSLRKPTWLFMPRTLRAEHYRSLKPALVVRVKDSDMGGFSTGIWQPIIFSGCGVDLATDGGESATISLPIGYRRRQALSISLRSSFVSRHWTFPSGRVPN